MKKPVNLYTKIKPIDVRPDTKIENMESDNFPWDNLKWSILLENNQVSLISPKSEDNSITIPKGQFDKMIEWYVKKQSYRLYNKNKKIIGAIE